MASSQQISQLNSPLGRKCSRTRLLIVYSSIDDSYTSASVLASRRRRRRHQSWVAWVALADHRLALRYADREAEAEA